MIPLSTRMRPNNLDDFFGQEHFLYKGSIFYNSIKNKNFDSAIFFGPSGTGKTTLARIVAREMDSAFVEINASVTGTKELKEILERAKKRFYGIEQKSTYIYIDEFHRWNKLQQDSLLKALEDGVIKFIGSTTENPYFTINNAILSRVRNIFEFRRISVDNIILILNKALNDKENGLGINPPEIDECALKMIAEFSGGDVRISLDTLGYIAANKDKNRKIDANLVQEAMPHKIVFYDNRDDKYNLLSGLQKSIRGSDPDAAVHYLARLLEGGEDIMTIGRRLLVIAAEDIGIAYPTAMSVTYAAVNGAKEVGMPEGRILLTEAVILLASSPKSNRAYEAYNLAVDDLRNMDVDDVPEHLLDRNSGRGRFGKNIKAYKYPHSYGGYVNQQYLPDNLYKKNKVYYYPSKNGNEKVFGDFLSKLPNAKKRTKEKE